MEQFTREITKTLLDPVKDCAIEIAELSFDALTDIEIIKAIPVVGIIVKSCNSALHIRELFFAKKIAIFAQEIHNGSVSEDIFRKKREQLERNDKKFRREYEALIVAIDRQDKEEKPYGLQKFMLHI